MQTMQIDFYTASPAEKNINAVNYLWKRKATTHIQKILQ